MAYLCKFLECFSKNFLVDAERYMPVKITICQKYVDNEILIGEK